MPLLDAAPNWTLAQINQFVSQEEITYGGSLKAIGNKNGKTTITVNSDPDGSPATPSVITTDTPPAGANVIGTGKIYVSGTLTDATAYKP